MDSSREGPRAWVPNSLSRKNKPELRTASEPRAGGQRLAYAHKTQIHYSKPGTPETAENEGADRDKKREGRGTMTMQAEGAS